MITDEMLAVAAEEVSLCMIEGLPSYPHHFSEAFEKKMRKLLRRTLHPVRYQVLRYTAAVLAAIFTIFGALFAFSPEVRAAVIGWVKSAFHEFFEYSSEAPSPTNTDVEYDYFLSDSCGDYTLLTAIDTEDGKSYIYTNPDGQILQFSYVHDTNDNSLFIKTDGYDVLTGSVGDCAADIYIALDTNESNAIIWQDTSENILFSIFAYAEADELCDIARNVKKVEIP